MKDFLLFKKIFEKSQGKDQAERFEDAKKKLIDITKLFTKLESDNEIDIEIIFEDYKNIFNNIKEELSKKEESKSDEFINQMVKYFKIKNEKTIKDISMIIKSKTYEMVVKSIKFFFENFENRKLTLPKNIDLSEMNLKNLEKTLKDLKDNKIFDYETKSINYKVFTSFNEKKEAIDFLIKKKILILII